MTTWHVVNFYTTGKRWVFARSTEEAARWYTKVLVADHLNNTTNIQRVTGVPVTLHRIEDYLAVFHGSRALGTYYIEPCENSECPACARFRTEESEPADIDLALAA
jgi:hypothetical protein